MTSGEQIAARLQQVLSGRGLVLSDVSRESRLRYPADRGYWIPHNFYARLRIADFNPRMEHVLALSAISKYRLVDWLTLFGFHLDAITSCAAALPADRTVLLDSSVYDDEAEIQWFRSKAASSPLPTIAPLGQLLEPGPLQPLKSLLRRGSSPFLYAKVGRQDALAFPDLLPGSIVRVDRRLGPNLPNSNSHALYLVEHARGLTCCRLHLSKRNRVTLRSTELPYAEVALQLGQDARILGSLDWELRFVASPPAPEVPRDLARFWDPKPLPARSANHDFSEFLALGRRRMGLSLRDASARSRLVADILDDPRFFCARGTLAAYEKGVAPTQIPKVLALCALYSFPFWDILRAAGWATGNLGLDPIPRTIEPPLGFPTTPRERQTDFRATGFLHALLEDFNEVPFFLRNSLAALVGLPDLFLRDILWLGKNRPSFHPYLASAVLAAVNGRERRPPSLGAGLPREQPLYLLLRRDGSYLCARCTLQDRLLVVHPFADGFSAPVHLRNGVDAEIVGRVVALLRNL